MIYTNFILFILAIMIFTVSPEAGNKIVGFPFNLYGVLLTFLVFWQFNRFRFVELRKRLDREEIGIYRAKQLYQSVINRNNATAIAFFAAAVYLFDLKSLLMQVPYIGGSHTFLNLTGLTIFICFLAATWFWAYQTMGDVLAIGYSTTSYIWGNVKFNLAIVIPWMVLSVILDTIDIESLPLLIQLGGFTGFLILLAVIAPVFVVRFWDCKPLEDSELKQDILTYCESQGVRFKQIMSWNALNRSLVTAGVIGLIYPFRYLMITPELMRVLDHGELMAVVSHEVGHVKRKHMFYYLYFFIVFMFIGISIEVLLGIFFNTTPAGMSWWLWMQGAGSFMDIVRVFIMIALFVVYFRFLFGYFIRNFERQADVYCFQSGINPHYMINSFVKLGTHLGDDGKKPNWHHYNLSQRIDFIQKSIDNPGLINRHNMRVKRSLLGFTTVVAVLLAVMYNPIKFTGSFEFNYQATVNNINRLIDEKPNDPRLYSALGEIAYQAKKWEQSRNSYEKSLKLNYYQPGVLNNLAWFYLKCEDTRFLDPQRALELAIDAAKLEQSPHVLDTLAEAYFQNGKYKEAYMVAGRALEAADENVNYYKGQLAKMQKFYKRFKNTIKI